MMSFPSFYVGVGDPNSGPCACTSSILGCEPSPQPIPLKELERAVFSTLLMIEKVYNTEILIDRPDDTGCV